MKKEGGRRKGREDEGVLSLVLSLVPSFSFFSFSLSFFSFSRAICFFAHESTIDSFLSRGYKVKEIN
jgi:hypothetical protein